MTITVILPMKCSNLVHSSVVKHTSLSKTMGCDDNVHNNCVTVVHTKVKIVVPFVSETIKTGNSCDGNNVDTLKVVQNDSETTNSIETSKLIDQERHCKLHSCCNSCTYCFSS